MYKARTGRGKEGGSEEGREGEWKTPTRMEEGRTRTHRTILMSL